MKKAHSSTPPEEVSTKRGTWEEYYDIHTLRMKPVDDRAKSRIAEDLIKWAQKDGQKDFAFRINDFIDSRGLCSDSFYKWIKVHEDLKRAYAFAMSRIASRRERGACTRRFDATSIYKSLGHYCRIEREEQKLRADLTKDQLEAERSYVVNMLSAKKPE